MEKNKKRDLTPMEQFVIDLMTKEKEPVNEGWIAYEWKVHKGKGGGCASRDMFGNTSAAYRTVRRLLADGFIEVKRGRFDGYVIKK